MKYKIGDILEYSDASKSKIYYVNEINDQFYVMTMLCSSLTDLYDGTVQDYVISHVESLRSLNLLTQSSSAPADNNARHNCYCPIFEVVHFGCKCGGI